MRGITFFVAVVVAGAGLLDACVSPARPASPGAPVGAAASPPADPASAMAVGPDRHRLQLGPGTAESTDPGAREPALRFGGVYEAQVDDASGKYSEYLRFDEKGLVIAVSSTGTPAEISSWFTPAHAGVAKGHYELHGAHLVFSTRSMVGVVDYDGIVLDVALRLKSHSQINGYDDEMVYRFVPDPR